MPRPFPSDPIPHPHPRRRSTSGSFAVAAATVALGVTSSLALSLAAAPPLRAASALLESVKQNPALAKGLCEQFKSLNAEGKSATSPASIAMVAKSQGLSPVDAEVLTTYVIGLHCPDVR